MRLGIILVNNQLDANYFPYIFISKLYMFRATMCSSSGESIVSIRHLAYVTLCRWPSGMQVWMELHPYLHTRRPPKKSDICQMSYWYGWCPWWWAHGCSKHVEFRNKYKRIRIVCQVSYLQELLHHFVTQRDRFYQNEQYSHKCSESARSSYGHTINSSNITCNLQAMVGMRYCFFDST